MAVVALDKSSVLTALHFGVFGLGAVGVVVQAALDARGFVYRLAVFAVADHQPVYTFPVRYHSR